MKREYFKWYSPHLRRDMELLAFGHAGFPWLIFPTSMGRFFDYESRGMIAVVAGKVEAGALQFFCVDSVDSESWYNKQIHPRQRVDRHLDYERYLLNEAVPFIRQRSQSPPLGVAGCSFGGFHSVNFALRHPDVVTHCISMGGAFDIHQFLDGYYDDECYFNCPPDFLPNLNDPWYLDRYRRNWHLLATGEHDFCWNENERLAEIMRNKQVNQRLDVWRDGAGHDWPWWQKMAQSYF